MAPQKSPGGDASPFASVDGRQVDLWEKEAMERAKMLISAIEEAMAVYEGAKTKPEGLEKKYESYKRMHKALTAWVRKVLLEKTLTVEERMRRIQELVYISLYGEG
jgi:hypothetical protein